MSRGCVARKEQVWVEEAGLASGAITVQSDDRVGGSQAGLGLATAAWTFDEDGTRGSKARSQLCIDDPCSVVADLAREFHRPRLGAQM